jgi:hypothetical protein
LDPPNLFVGRAEPIIIDPAALGGLETYQKMKPVFLGILTAMFVTSTWAAPLEVYRTF